MNNYAVGADVSYWNGPNKQYSRGCNWSQAKGGGVLFGFARACWTYYPDPTFDKNWDGMKKAGVLRSGYCYFIPSRDPKRQAQILYSQTRAEGEIPDVIDVENHSDLDRNIIKMRIEQFVNEYISLSGVVPIVYTRASFWDYYVGNWKPHKKCLLWVAHYYTDNPAIPKAWDDWLFWQESDIVNFKGFQDPTSDRDYFNGNEKELLERFNGGEVSKNKTIEERVSQLEEMAHVHS